MPSSLGRRFTRLVVERLEDRCLPSAALPLDIGDAVDPTGLLDDPLFSTHDAGARRTLLAVLTSPAGDGKGQAGIAAAPVVGNAASSPGPQTPAAAPKTASPQHSVIV